MLNDRVPGIAKTGFSNRSNFLLHFSISAAGTYINSMTVIAFLATAYFPWSLTEKNQFAIK